MSTKLCLACKKALPVGRRTTRRYCDARCRGRAHFIRASAGRRPLHPRRNSRPTQGAAAENDRADTPPVLTTFQQLDEERARHQQQETAWHEELVQAKAELEAVRTAANREVERARRQAEFAQNLLKLQKSLKLEVRRKLKKAEQGEHASHAAREQAERQIAGLQKVKQRRSAAREDEMAALVPDLAEEAQALSSIEEEMQTTQRRFAGLVAENQRLSNELVAAHIELSQQKIQAKLAAPAPKVAEPLAGFLERAVKKLLSGLAEGFGYEAGKVLEARIQDTHMLPAAAPDREIITISISYPRSTQRPLAASTRQRRLLNSRSGPQPE